MELDLIETLARVPRSENGRVAIGDRPQPQGLASRDRTEGRQVLEAPLAALVRHGLLEREVVFEEVVVLERRRLIERGRLVGRQNTS